MSPGPDGRRSTALVVHFQRYPDIRIAKQVRALGESGWRTVVLARRDDTGRADGRGFHPYATRLPADGDTEVVGLLAPDDGRLRAAATMPYGLNPVWRRAVTEQVRRVRPDVLLVRDIPLVPAAVAAGRRHGVPVVLDMAENYPAVLAEWRRDEGPRRRLTNAVLRNIALARRLEQWAVDHVDEVITVVPESADRVRRLVAGRRTGLPVHVVENTPVVADLEAAAASVDDLYPSRAPLEVVYTGEIHYYRGIDTVVEAARLLAADGGPAVRWTLVGTGKPADRLAAAAREAGVGAAVRFLGWQPDLVPYIAQADVGVVPSRRSAHTDSTMPNKLYDYMALRLPVVVSDVAPMARVVRSSQCGEVFAAGDAQGLAAAVRRLGDAGRRQVVGAAGRAAVDATYTWRLDGPAFVDLLTAASRGRVRPGADAG